VGLSQMPVSDGLLGAGLLPYWHFSGVMHPAVAHFPIALLMVAALVESWSVIRRQRKPMNTTLICLCIGAAAAVVASVLGWANADASGETGDTFNLHKWLGIAVAGVAVVTLVMSFIVHRRETPGAGLVWGYRGGVFVGAALVGLVGSLGGKLVHGDSYYDDAILALKRELSEGVGEGTESAVTKVKKLANTAIANAGDTVEKVPPMVIPPATTQSTGSDLPPASPDATVTLLGGRIDYARDIEPIFVAHCVKCHGDKKKKGDYRLDSFERVFAAGESGTVPVLPGKSDESLLVKVIEGKGDYAESIMPPKGNPLSFQQITLIRRWIDQGAQSTVQ
jgi:uncharacterized membrane protein